MPSPMACLTITTGQTIPKSESRYLVPYRRNPHLYQLHLSLAPTSPACYDAASNHPMSEPAREPEPAAPRVFATTHWSVVLAAGQVASDSSRSALESLCRAYWYPIYVYVRRKGNGPDDAQDLTQEFFAQLISKEHL